jgi:hypothetical protein
MEELGTSLQHTTQPHYSDFVRHHEVERGDREDSLVLKLEGKGWLWLASCMRAVTLDRKVRSKLN